ncbi:MAG: MFS transporter [Melioribacteraceae bacterium]|nr:MFS transporter [Melioribacteraceae bacterium]MCF8264549.1 MFS transporter [Melioribacteraceae bacterium]MCF8413743.1 MFS transporter [Melioribacteraceae bacterium]MCF8432585.1 MFS transporter [Melioribacteraceae bacterium]
MPKKASLLIIFMTVFIDLLGFGILIPILPTFASKNLGVSDFGIGIIVAGYSLMQFIFNPILGKLSDRYGRKPFIVWPLLMVSFSYLIFSFSNSFFLLLLSRVIAGIGGSNIGVAQAYISDVTTKSNRAKGMGLIGAAFGLGFVFGPFIGGVISKYGYDVAGFFSAGFSFLASLFAFIFLKESNNERKDKVRIRIRIMDFSALFSVLKTPIVGILVTIFFIIIFSIANIYGTFSLLGFKYYSFTDAQNGYLFGIMGIVSATIQGLFIRPITAKFQDRSILLTGVLFMSFGLGAIPYGVNFLGVAIVVGILSIGTGLLQPTVLSMISKFSDERRQGEVLGLNSSMASLARVFGPVWGGFSFHYIGFEFPFLTGAFFTLLTFFIVLFLLSSQRLRQFS